MSRSSRSTRCRCTAGWTSAPPSRRSPSETPCSTIWSTSPIRPRSGRSSRTQALARAAIADIEARGKRALLVGGTGLYVRAVVDGLEIPGQDLDGTGTQFMRRHRDTGRTRRRVRASAIRRCRAAARIEPSNRRRIVRALEVYRRDRPSLLVVRSGLRRRIRRPRSTCRLVGLSRCEHDARGAHRGAVRGHARRRPRRRGCRVAASTTGALAHCGPGHRLRRDARLRRRRHPDARRRVHPGRSGGHAGSLDASGCGSGGTRGSSGSRPQRKSEASSPRRSWQPGRVRSQPRCDQPRDVSTSMHLSKLHATGNDFLVRLALDDAAGRARREHGRRAVRPPPRHRRRRPHHAPTGQQRRRLHDDVGERRRRRARR